MPDLTLPGAGDSSEGKTGGPKSNLSHGAAARLPAVDRLLASPQLNAVAAEHGTLQVKRSVQEVLAENRSAIVAGAAVPDSETLIAQVQVRLSQIFASRLRTVFNLSGTVIHTNLGRALLAEERSPRSARRCAATRARLRRWAAAAAAIATISSRTAAELTGAEAATLSTTTPRPCCCR